MPLVTPNLPISTPLTQGGLDRRGRPQGIPGFMTQPWVDFFTSSKTTLDAAPERKAVVEVTSQSASIGATSFDLGTLAAGLYRVAWFARITTAAGSSSSLTVTIGFTHLGTSQTFSGAAITSNSTTAPQSNTVVVYGDALAPITYATTYASSGSPSMVYVVYLTVERLSA